MANGAVYSEGQFQVAIKAETSLGGALVTSMQYINIDAIYDPPLAGVEDLVRKAGVGNTLKAVDHYRNIKGARKEFTLSGVADQTVLPMLISNVMTNAVGAAPASYDIPYNYVAPTLLDNGVFSDDTGTFTVAWIPPQANKAKVYSGCVVTNLVIKGSALEDGGRVHFDATFSTGYTVSDNQASPTTPTAYPTTFYYLYDMNTTRQIAGVDVILNSFELTLENPAGFLGSQGANSDPQEISRGTSGDGCSAKGTFNVVYDDNTDALFTTNGAGSNLVFEFSNHATWASATTFGLMGSYGKIGEPTFDHAESGSSINVPVTFAAHTSGDVLQLIA